MKKLLLGTALALAACAPSNITPVTVPLQYKPVATAIDYPPSQSCASIARVDVTDSRDNTTTLGVRSLQEKQDMKADVTSSGDVAIWARNGAESALKLGGVSTNSSGPVLRLSVNNLRTVESVYHRAQYSGRVALTGELVSNNGRSCWKGDVDGASENYGYAGSAENYQETLNHALDRAVIKILENADFKRAVCNCR